MKETILLEAIGYIVSTYEVTTVTDYEFRQPIQSKRRSSWI